MPLPSLIHSVGVRFQLLDRVNTVYDAHAREPVRQATRSGTAPGTGTVVDIKGQISFYFAGAKLDYAEWLKQGVLERSVGYVALRFIDMRRKGLLTFDSDGNFLDIRIKRGDRIILLGKRVVNLYVVGFKDFAHYPNLSQTMIQINFEDRHPSAQSGDL